jgi:hypothetical protein
MQNPLGTQEMYCGWLAPGIGLGGDQLEPLKYSTSPLLTSRAAQNVRELHESCDKPDRPPLVARVGGDQCPPLYTNV